MFDILIKELENIRKSFFKNWIILSIIGSTALVSIAFIFIFLYFEIFFQRGETIKQKFLTSLPFILFIFANFIVVPLVASFIISYIMSKIFSFISKGKIFSFIKKLGDDIEIISYQQKSEDLKNIAKKIYQNFDEYNQEDNFIIKLNGKDIKICEVKLTKGRGKYRHTIFQGIVISIPAIYAKNEIKEHKIVKENNYTHIFMPQAKDLFELSIMKPIKQEDIEKIVKQLKDYVDIASKLIKEEDDS
jgi:hypothetical protein